jgi:hypothetical protein
MARYRRSSGTIRSRYGKASAAADIPGQKLVGGMDKLFGRLVPPPPPFPMPDEVRRSFEKAFRIKQEPLSDPPRRRGGTFEVRENDEDE